jgi:hypothetical protein
MSTEYNIVIDQGETWIKSITWKDSGGVPYDLSDYGARMMVRKHYADNDKGQPLVSLTDTDGITLGAAVDNIVITIEDSVTETIPGATYYYDLELISPSQEVTKLLRGKVTVLPEVTR